MNGRIRGLALLAAAAGSMWLQAAGTPNRADAAEFNFTVTIDRVLLNASGGIRVEGTMDCTAAVELVYGTEPSSQPDLVLASVDWDAIQYVGRTKVVHGSYEAAIAHPCWKKGEPGPQTWSTVSPFPEGALTWVYGSDGRFTSGKIHVEAFGTGGWPVWSGSLGPELGDLYDWAQADLRAIRVR